MNKKKQIHKCDYCNNEAVYDFSDDYTELCIYVCKECIEKMNKETKSSISKS